MPPSVIDRAAQPDGHVVHFYDADDELVSAVRGFLTEALSAGGAVIVVATAPHRCALETAITAAGVDVAAMRECGRFISTDATELLATFMLDERPDPQLFEAAVRSLLSALTLSGQPIRVY